MLALLADPAVVVAGAVAVVVAFAGAAAVLTRLLVRRIEARYPARGRLLEVGGRRMHVIDRPAADPTAPTIVVLHGTLSTALDSYAAFADALAPLGRLVFVDRPGHGYSTRRLPDDTSPAGQAEAVAGVLDRLGIDRAVVVGHSYGGAVAAAFAVHHPQRTIGLVLVTPATHPWPGPLDWSYRLLGAAFAGPIVAQTIATPVGLAILRSAVAGVFAPEEVPADYMARSGIALALRPAAFRASAAEVGALRAEVARLAPRYGEIAAPTVVIGADCDAVVSTEIHARAFADAVPGARLIVLAGAGHAPQHTRTAVVAEAVRSVIEARQDGGREARQAVIEPTAR
jgi:pimeloyl-ACP methyl ester carboxylesterase